MVLYHILKSNSITFRYLASQSRRRRVYHQFRRNCISSTRSVVYHQAAGKYTLARDEIQPHRGWWYAPHFARRWYAKPAAWIKKHVCVCRRAFLAHHGGLWTQQRDLFDPFVSAISLRKIATVFVMDHDTPKSSHPHGVAAFWRTMADSNRRHQASEACALSIWANGAFFSFGLFKTSSIIAHFFTLCKRFLPNYLPPLRFFCGFFRLFFR